MTATIANKDMSQPTGDTFRQMALGIGAMMLAMAIFASNFVVSRYGTTGTLTAFDLVALRYGVAGGILSLVMLRNRLEPLRKLGLRKCLTLACLAGAPYMLLIFWGVTFISATRAATINAGVVPIATAGLTYLVFGTPLRKGKLVALAVIVCGLVLLTSHIPGAKTFTIIGDVLLALSGVSWAGLYICIRLWKIDSFTVTGAVSVLSFVMFLPLYLLFCDSHIPDAPVFDVFVQGVNQGVMTAFVALFLVAYGVKRVGAENASVFAPLVPVFSAVLSIFLLSEAPTLLQCAGIVLVILGMLLTFYMDRSAASKK